MIRERALCRRFDLDQPAPAIRAIAFGVTSVDSGFVISFKRVRSVLRGEVTTMKCRLIILALAILFAPAFGNAALAATVNMRSITCSEYLAMPAASSSKFSAWMTGWFTYQSSRTYVDFDLHRANVASVRTWCQSNPIASVMVGLEKAIGVNALAGATLDFNKMTCGNWLGYGPEDRDFVTYFMSGYYTAAAGNSVLDYDRLQRNSNAVAAYCKKNKSRTLPTAIQNRAS